MFWIFVSTPRPNSFPSPICNHSMLLHFSLFHPLLPPNSPGSIVSVHLDVYPTHRPPILSPTLNSLVVLDLIPRHLPAHGFSRCIHVVAVYLVRLPPICRPWRTPMSLSAPRGYSFRGYLPPSAASVALASHPFLLSLIGGPVLDGPKGFPLCSPYPTIPFSSDLTSLLLQIFLVSSGV